MVLREDCRDGLLLLDEIGAELVCFYVILRTTERPAPPIKKMLLSSSRCGFVEHMMPIGDII